METSSGLPQAVIYRLGIVYSLFYNLDLFFGFPLAIEYDEKYSFRHLKFEYVGNNKSNFEHPFSKFTRRQ